MSDLYKRTSSIETTCGTCVFADRDENGQQTGCKLGKLENFINKDQARLNGDSYVIETLCRFCRNTEWADKQDPEVDIAKKVRQESTVHCNLIIMAEGSTEEEILETVRSIKSQIVPPKNVSIILNSSEVKVVKLFDKIRDILKDSSIVYDIVKVIDKEKEMPYHIDGVVKTMFAHYYSLFEAGFKIPDNFIKKIDDIFNEDMKRFVLIQPTEGINGLTVQVHLHKNLMGNDGGDIQDKIKWIAEDQARQSFVITEDLI